jgi:hypothetical protein
VINTSGDENFTRKETPKYFRVGTYRKIAELSISQREDRYAKKRYL